MGTHPIFESDFDCLTDQPIKMAKSQMEFILQNMQKELEGQVKKVNKVRNEKDGVGKRIGQFEAQLSETQVVQSELDLLSDDAVVYKLLGPVLVKQDKEEALTTVKSRSQYMESELKKCEKSLKDIQKKWRKSNLTFKIFKSKHNRSRKQCKLANDSLAAILKLLENLDNLYSSLAPNKFIFLS